MIATMPKKKKRRGPPPLPADKVRSEQLRILLTPGERSVIEKAAAVRGMLMSDYARSVLIPDAERTIEEAGE